MWNARLNESQTGIKIARRNIKNLSYADAAAAAKSLQSCPTLCDPIDSSPSGSPIPGILQARTLEWVAISFSNAWKWKVKVKSLSHVQPSATPWNTAFQAPLSMGFSRQVLECVAIVVHNLIVPYSFFETSVVSVVISPVSFYILSILVGFFSCLV